MEETEKRAGASQQASRRAQILEAAARVFAEQGFHATSVREVARAAGVADGTIYTHFENKGALLLGLFELLAERARQQSAPTLLAGDDPRAFLSAVLRQPLAALTAGNFELFRVVVSEVLVNGELARRFLAHIHGPMLQAADEVLARLGTTGALAPERRDATVRTISSLILGLIVQRVMGDELLAARWDNLPDQLADLLLHGLVGERA